ncbi:MAG: NnrU family protein [Devosiaceae bacterium]|nr:NnrU family protein [Devosiaceae bacterium MH13]
MVLFLIGLVGFLGVHSVRIVAPGVRETIVQNQGLNTWKLGYTVISLVTFVLLVMGYADAKLALGPLWQPPVWISHITVVLMLPALIALAAAYVPSKLKARLKHPMLVAIKIWALAHLLANGWVIHLLVFGAFLTWAVADRISVKRRGEPDPVAPSGWTGDAIAVGVGVVAWIVLIGWAHVWLFGVAPIG